MTKNYIKYCRQNTIPDHQLADIISKVFTDHPKHPPLPYNFRSSNPSLKGQIGVPPIVDKILGSIIYSRRSIIEQWGLKEWKTKITIKYINGLSISGEKNNGFYIEAGAYNGELFSNSLLFELKRNYTGVIFIKLFHIKFLVVFIVSIKKCFVRTFNRTQ